MNGSNRVLIVGGDARLSKRLAKLYSAPILTTRRKELVNNISRFYLDFEDISSIHLPPNINIAIIVGGPITYAESNSNVQVSLYAHQVSIPEVVYRLVSEGSYVLYISSNMVYGQDCILRREEDIPKPSIQYGRLKTLCENEIIKRINEYGNRDKLAILRLTKNVSIDTSPFKEWIFAYKNGHIIRPFSDLYFCPVNFDASANACYNLSRKKLAGIYHFSGDRNISYLDFITGVNHRLLELDMPQFNYVPSSSMQAGIKLEYYSANTELNMDFTTSTAGIYPVTINESIDYFISLLLDSSPSEVYA